MGLAHCQSTGEQRRHPQSSCWMSSRSLSVVGISVPMACGTKEENKSTLLWDKTSATVFDIGLCKNTGSVGDYGFLFFPMTASAKIQPLPCCQCESKYTGYTMTYPTVQPPLQLGKAPSHRYLCRPTREATGSETIKQTNTLPQP